MRNPALSLWSDEYGGAWSLQGDGLIDGNLTVTGSLTTAKLADNAVNNTSYAVGATYPLTSNNTTPGGQIILRPTSPNGLLRIDVVISSQRESGFRPLRCVLKATQDGVTRTLQGPFTIPSAVDGPPMSFFCFASFTINSNVRFFLEYFSPQDTTGSILYEGFAVTEIKK